MKGQAKVVVFLILFFISLVLFSSANLWGRGIIQQNIDTVNIENAEKFMINLDNEIKSLIEYGGNRMIDYNFNAQIELKGTNVIEITFPSSINIPGDWINLTYGETSYIQEKYTGSDFLIRLVYPQRNDYIISFFIEGSPFTIPQHIKLEKNQSTNYGDTAVILIEISFIK